MMERNQMQLWRTLGNDSNYHPMAQLGNMFNDPAATMYAHPNPAAQVSRQRIFFQPRQKQYRGFTNLSAHPVKYNGKEYPSSEHLYQAFKYMDNRPDIAERVRTVSKNPTKAFIESMKHTANQHPDWDRMCISKMEIAVWHKVNQNEELKRELLGTGDAELVNDTGCDFWGVGKHQKGRNELGKVLERVRSSLLKM
ncbi:hypothetical protein C8R44DRAFT_705010 [Mycena epipterygia]|nr:hypothetical protein C8R44DRAFT_705010 [Mycena epipterygia]